jgi:phosphoribosyl-ATP pyrophosphohydrolase/phosphoribosyl-AMP cyclohydrolase
MMSLEILRELYDIIRDRKSNPVEGSYTCKLFAEGLDEILKKVGEEAVELVIAGKSRDRGQVVYEAADLLYHMMVLLVYEGIGLEEVLEELERRRGKRRDH